MQTKTYFANSVPAALEVARKELGADALLVNSKPSPPAARPFGRLEVTFAYEIDPAEPAPLAAVPEPARRPVSELDEIRQQISALRMAVGRTGPVAAEDFSQGTSLLIDAGLEQTTARDIASAAARRPGDRTAALALEIASRINAASFGEMKQGEGRALAFIGPAGRGKSTTLVKVAVQFGIARRVPVRIYSAGSHGVGCQEQMARYATLIGVPFQSCESLDGLGIALNDGWRGLTLIDTPGLSPADRVEMSDFERFFARRSEIEKHLVLRADSHAADTSHVISRFSGLGPSHLLFTGLDEALSVGGMVSALLRSGISSVFWGTGSQIPDDLSEMNAMKLAHSLFGDHALAAVAA